jgi:glycosyltransferase involved in cell wall biosynthesis
MRKLALIIPTMVRGGAEKQLCLLATNLPRDQIEVHVFLLTHDGPRSDELRAAGIPVTLIGKRFKADPTAYFRLRRWLKDWDGDVMHSWLFAANAYARHAAKKVGVPVILGSERCVDRWKTETHFAIDRYLVKRTDGITTNSHGVLEFYREHGIPESKIFVIANGILARNASEISREEAARRLGIEASRNGFLPSADSGHKNVTVT